MTGRLSFPAEWKAVPGDPGELEGYASVFGNVDQGGDIVLPGAFRKTLADWSRSRQPLPLIADHDLTTEGVIGSVSNAAEDATGLRITARFSSDPKAQSVRTKMIEGHIRGMSFTYETVRSYVGTAAGKSVRYLQELKLFEATVTPFPMNQLALASAKGPGDDWADDEAKLRELELWAAGATATGALADLMADPDRMMRTASVLAEAKARRDLNALEQWAESQPRIRTDPTAAPPLSRAELANRAAIDRAYFSPPRRCGVCWKCQLNAACDVYR
jgi:HK97 family phage prohead protease